MRLTSMAMSGWRWPASFDLTVLGNSAAMPASSRSATSSQRSPVSRRTAAALDTSLLLHPQTAATSAWLVPPLANIVSIIL